MVLRKTYLKGKGCITLFLCITLAACKPSVPRNIIQPDDMEDILYDYHIAEAIAYQEPGDGMSYQMQLYRQAVLKKHGVTKAEFDSSMVYYTRHTERLHAIYENLVKRMGDEALALGADVNEVNRYNISEGDTANIWTSERNFVLFPMKPYNLVTFYAQADSSYHHGDRFVMSFDANFIFQDGSRNAVAQMAIRFKNDSVATRMMHISTNTHFSMEVPNKDSLGIKDVRAFVYLTKDYRSSQTTLKLLQVSNMKLMRCHIDKKKEVKTMSEQSGKTNSSPLEKDTDSIRQSVPIPKQRSVNETN